MNFVRAVTFKALFVDIAHLQILMIIIILARHIIHIAHNLHP
jgi:hypothetical protein